MEPAVNLEDPEIEIESEDVSTPVNELAISLPSSVKALLDNRKRPMKTTLNDQVETIHVVLWENEKYRNFLDAVYSEQAVEGDLHIDDSEAARMIRDYAMDNGMLYVAEQKLGTLVKAMNVVMRRYRISRKERRLD